MARYPRAIRVNYGLDLANVFAADLGQPALASANRFVASTNMKVGAYTVANPSSADGLARNIVATITAATGNDTPGTLLIEGTDNDGRSIEEELTLVAGGTATGAKAFKTVTAITGAGWVINGGNDTIVVGTGNLIGLPGAVLRPPKITATTDVIMVVLGNALTAPVVTYDASELAKNTVNATAATYDGTKRLYAYIKR